jgi:ABC-2 type transport system ATP-binding protein
MQPAIEARALEAVRGGRHALRALDATVRLGSVTGLLGPSGSGKTTFIRCVMGVQQIAAGAVLVLGLSAGSPSLRHRIGYVTQSPSVYADLTVRENLAYFARLVRHAR